MEYKYNRILLKLSGESLAQEKKFGIDFDYLLKICSKIAEVQNLGIGVGIVVGGGNFWRGRSNEHMDRVTADHIGMLGTIMNALAIGDAFKQIGAEVRVMSSIAMHEVSEPFCKNRALRHLEKGRVVVFGGGTGSPFFSTDSASALRAAETKSEVVIKLTDVDGVYDSDPKKNKNAKKYDEVSFNEVLEKDLKVMDGAAIAICRDSNIPIEIVDVSEMDNLMKLLMNEKVGTLVK